MQKTKLYIADVNILKNSFYFEKAYKLISDNRKNKIDKLKFNDDKCLATASEILLINALSDLNISYNDLEFDYIKNNKPYIKNLNIFFNTSHSNDYAICTVSCDEVGCDIEKIREINLKLAKRFFHKKEYEMLVNQLSKEKQKDLFFKLWCIKESFIKNTGLGFQIPLKSFSINFDNEINVEQNFDINSYFFKEYNVSKDYKCFVCAKNNNFDEKFETVNLKNLLDFRLF